MHYAALAGISVGRENLKTIKFGAGFSPTIFDSWRLQIKT
jgi:hypothetical protein